MTTTFENGKLYGTLWSANDKTYGTVEVIRERSGELVVVRSDLNRVHERITGFKTFKKALEEAKCYADR